jgi:hypothetical protein
MSEGLDNGEMHEGEASDDEEFDMKSQQLCTRTKSMLDLIAVAAGVSGEPTRARKRIVMNPVRQKF